MSREIKFRAWDKQKKQMVCGIEETYDALPYSELNEKVELDIYNHMSCFSSWLCGDYEVMQYTGIKDKNGVKIYERDIVNITRKSHVGIGGFGKMFYEEMKTTKTVEFSQENAYGLDFQHCHYEVIVEIIGNAYENKNLLEEK